MENIHPLKKVSYKILEDWGLMLVDEAEISESLFDKALPLYMSWIDLNGVIKGAISIVAQEPFIRNLASNLLGSDIDVESDFSDCQDAFKEMVNVLAGNFVTEAYGEDAVFDLINPNVKEIPFKDLEKFSQRKVVYAFEADSFPVAVTFSIKE